MCALGAVVCMVFSFYTAGGLLYGAKDFDLLSSLPIKKSTVILSKLTLSYIIDFLFILLIALPAFIVYADFGGIITIEKVARTFLMLLFLPIVPMCVSIILSALFLLVSSRFKHANLIQICLFAIFFIAYLLLSFLIPQDTTMQIGNVYFLKAMLESGFVDWLSMLSFLGVNALSALVVLAFVVLTYEKINTIIKSKKTTSNYKVSTYKSSSLTKALLKKEIKMLFSYPIYPLNTLLGPLLGLILSIAMLVLCSQVSLIRIMGITIAPIVCPFALMMSPITACSISIEGSSFWVLRTSPVPTKAMLRAKLLLNALFYVIPATISSILLIIVIWSAGIEYCALLFVIGVVSALLGGNIGLLLNLLLPVLKWETPNRVVKQGGAVALSSFFAMFVCALLAVVLFVWTYQNLFIKYVIIASVLVLAFIITSIIIATKGEKLLNKKVQL
jgi:ABC-2 type transport system permease protein